MEKQRCKQCGKYTIRIADTKFGILCEKCIVEIRNDLACDLAIIKCNARDRNFNSKT
jgi:hypothetical protein